VIENQSLLKLLYSILTIVTLPHTMVRSSREVRLAKTTSCGLSLNSVVPVPSLTWYGRPRQTHWGKNGLHTWVERYCGAWLTCMPIELFIATSKVKMFSSPTMLKWSLVRRTTHNLRSYCC